MPPDNLTPSGLPPADDSVGRGLVPAGRRDLGPVDYGGYGDYYGDGLPTRGEQGPGMRRYLAAVLRRKWLLALAVLVGAAGAVGSYRYFGVQYTAQGNIWVQEPQRAGGRQQDLGPIAQGQLLPSAGWLQLLKSFAVLDTVAVAERLYLSVPRAYAPAFDSFSLADRMVPGSYVIKVGPDGRRFTLTDANGALIQRGTLGDSIGTALGFRWRPKLSAFAPSAQVRFIVRTPRDAAEGLQSELVAQMDRNGDFISLSLSGANPRHVAGVLNAVMDQFVAKAAQLKRSHLDAQLTILQRQLDATETALHQAEQSLENFRVKTITLPSDGSTPTGSGPQVTQSPVFNRFFDMKVELEQTKRDMAQLQQAMDSLNRGSVRIELLEAVPEVTKSAEMTQALTELVGLRASVRTMRNQYTEDYPPIQDTLTQIRTLEHRTIPRMAANVMEALRVTAAQLSTMVDSASDQLRQIPQRTIEEARLQRQVSIQGSLYNDLRSRVETAQLAAAGAIPSVQILDRAVVPEVPTADRRLRSALMIILASLGGALALAILLDRMDSKIQYPDEVNSTIGLEILGSVPRVAPLAGRHSEENSAQVVEAFRELRVTVSFAYGRAGPMVLAISSPAQGEGKTLVTTNLAVAFAEMGKRTLLIDGDTRQGDAHRLLAAVRKPGLTDYLQDRSQADIIQKTTYEHLDFIPCGSRGSGTPELLASERMTTFLGSLKRAYDVILIDCPPLAAGADALVLGGLAGNLAVVLRTGATDKRLTVARMETLYRLPIRILGAILNDVEPKGQYYKYHSYLPGYRTRREGDGKDEPMVATREGEQLLSTGAETKPEDRA